MFSETSLELPPGSGIILYTDGLVESRRHPLQDGMDRLRRDLRGATDDVAPAGPPVTARALLQRCVTASGLAVQTDDDTALLVMTT